MDEDHGIEQGAAPQEFEGNLFSRLCWAFVSPTRLYADINRAAIWWQPWFWVSVIGMLGLYVTAPVTRAVMNLNLGGQDPEQLRKTIEVMDKYSLVGYFIVPVAVLLQALIVSGIGYVVLSIIITQSTFKKYFTLYLYSNIIVSVGAVVSTLLVRARGVDSIQNIRDATVSFGLDFLVPEGHAFLEAAAASINVFSVWSFVIIAMGLMHLFRATLHQAILAVIPLWLVNMIFGMIAAALPKAG